MKASVISSSGCRTAEGENRENSQTTDLLQREHPVYSSLRRGLATGGEEVGDTGAAGRRRRRRGGGEAVAGRAAGKVRWRGERSSREAGLLG